MDKVAHDQEIEDWFRSNGPELAPVLRDVHDRVLALHPDAYRLFRPLHGQLSFGHGPSRATDHYAYVTPYRAHVALAFYQGARLSDPDGLLEGDGLAMRHLRLIPGEAPPACLPALLAEAIMLDRPL